MKKADVCREFGLVNPTIQNICQNISKIISAFKHNGSRIKRIRNAELSVVDEVLLKLFKPQRSDTTSEHFSSYGNFCSFRKNFKTVHF
jgi:hypothetical protein